MSFLLTLILVVCSAGQKAQQMTLEEHQQLMDCVCLWTWLKSRLRTSLDDEVFKRVCEMWSAGILGRRFWEAHISTFSAPSPCIASH